MADAWTPYDEQITNDGDRHPYTEAKREGYLRGVADTRSGPELASLVAAAQVIANMPKGRVLLSGHMRIRDLKSALAVYPSCDG